MLGQVEGGEPIFSGACTLENGEPQPWRFPLHKATLTAEHRFLGRQRQQGLGDAWWIMMQQLIMAWSTEAAGQERVQDTEDGNIHGCMSTPN